MTSKLISGTPAAQIAHLRSRPDPPRGTGETTVALAWWRQWSVVIGITPRRLRVALDFDGSLQMSRVWNSRVLPVAVPAGLTRCPQRSRFKAYA